MVKKYICVLIIVCSSIWLVACGNNKPTEYAQECVHEYNLEVIKPTCIAQGYDVYMCLKCKKTYTDNYVDALGHDYIEREQNYKCQRCDRYEDEGYTFELITTSMAQYNDAYKNLANTYQIKAVSSLAMENGTITIPRKHLGYTVSSLNRGSLYNVRNLIATVKFNSNVKYIGSSLFTYDGGFSRPNIPPTLSTIIFDDACYDINISHSAFQFCSNLSDVTFSNNTFSKFNHDDMVGNHYLFEGSKYYETNVIKENGLCYIKNLLLTSENSFVSSNVTIRDGTTIIANQVFTENTNIKSVSIPESIRYIGKKAFYKNLSLKSVIYKGTEEQFNLIEIEETAFELCNGIDFIYER